MRSLEVLEYTSTPLKGTVQHNHCLIATDVESSTVYVALQDSQQAIEVRCLQEPDLGFMELATTMGELVQFTFISDIQAACLATRQGDILLIYKERFDAGQDAVEVVGTVDSGIHAMTWSPDQDLVVLITGEKKVLVMTQDFEPITEFPLHVEEQGQGVQHSVGWGKKETQFHGSEGKQAAQQKVDTSKFTTSADDDQRPRIAWRGDGSFFVCSDIDPRNNARVLRIFNREGVLQNTSEPVDQLEHALDWRPSGNLIVSSQQLPHRHDIVFIERNGLRHGQFTLRGKDQHVRELTWSADSNVLAIVLEQDHRKFVQLWTMNNYHYYLKQEITLPDDDVLAFTWDPETPLLAHVLGRNQYHTYRLNWDVLTSTSTHHENAGYVAVIDGDAALMTPFYYQNVPPPMCSFKAQSNKPIQQVSFVPDAASCRMVTVSERQLDFFDLPKNGHGVAKLTASLTLPSAQEELSGFPRHVTALSENEVFYLMYDEASQSDTMCLARLNLDEQSIKLVSMKPLNGRAGQVHYNATNCDLLVETTDGTVYDVKLDNEELAYLPLLTLPTFCPWIAIAHVGLADMQERVVIALSDRSKLYANDRLLSSEATSFFLRHDWLVFSTTSHTARFLPLDVPFDHFKLSDNVPDANDESHRRVERGARIVLATQGKSNLVLQMPRGNLETISPRAFVLASIREDIQQLNYRSAFTTCRRNRIDLNILFDENPQQFFDNIESFVKQVHEVDFLNLFLSNLRNEDVTKTMYKHGDQESKVDEELLANKVNKICNAVRQVLMELDQDQYIQSILSTYVRSSPPDLESALSLLAHIRESSLAKAEEALKYTIFLCKADSLYNIALGMYNFPLVLMVAQQAQMDPREYLPFLQELQNLDTYYQRFRIDDHLERFEKALHNLSLCPDRFDQLIDYMVRHELYLVTLEIYANKPEQKKIVLDAYGAYLDGKKAYEEAGIVYTMANSLDKALQSYKSAGAWREAFTLTKRLSFSVDDIQALAYQLLDYLKDKRRFQEAAAVAMDYINDLEEAIDCLLKGSHWQEATRLAYTHNRVDVMDTHVKPALIDGYTHMDEDIDELTSQFSKQTARLKELREKKPEPTQVLPNDDTLDNIDMFSDTTSMYSQFTRYTQASSRVSTVSSRASRKSSKQKRRDERKRARGKKGTVFEEEYLVSSLKRLYERASNLQSDMGNLLRALVPFEYVEEARTIQAKFDSFLGHLKEAMPTIFVPLKLIDTQYGSTEEMEEAKKLTADIEKPVIAAVQWKLQIL
ncbi:IkappaB kinase complex, IKAP component [Hesseltinella vesiculosa]|uniref:Elongator complex protein 1 n=1 Tax=Hesseltinella vesiculosa TaxID=101127 RepID=A0A1X2GVU8_9FUNG|nr:IkappaB kinase complex, IKAP component [Hesseltinella vesiculosa]